MSEGPNWWVILLVSRPNSREHLGIFTLHPVTHIHEKQYRNRSQTGIGKSDPRLCSCLLCLQKLGWDCLSLLPAMLPLHSALHSSQLCTQMNRQRGVGCGWWQTHRGPHVNENGKATCTSSRLDTRERDEPGSQEELEP